MPVFPEVIEQLDKLAAELKIKPLRERQVARCNINPSPSSGRVARAEAIAERKVGWEQVSSQAQSPPGRSLTCSAHLPLRGMELARGSACYFGAIASRTRATVSAGVL